MAQTRYVVSVHDSKLRPFYVQSDLPANASTWGGYRPDGPIDAVWQIEASDSLTMNDQLAVCAALDQSAGIYLGADIKVTRIYPPEPTPDEQIEAARRVLRADYWQDVRNVADDIKSAIESRELTSDQEVEERLDETVDGHSRVIYTTQAMEGLLYSDNTDAYTEEMGEAALDESGDINYSALMYYAFRADVMNRLGDIEQLIEDAQIYCDECGDALDSDEIDASAEGDPLCADCREDEDERERLRGHGVDA